MDKPSSTEIVFLKDREWINIDGQLCLVLDFVPMMGSSVNNGVVSSPAANTPYASLTLRTNKISGEFTGFVTHKIDFSNLWSVFKDIEVDHDKEEVLIYWTARHYNSNFLQLISNIFIGALGAFGLPKIIVMVCPKGTYKSSQDFYLQEKEEVRVFVYGLSPSHSFIPEVIK